MTASVSSDHPTVSSIRAAVQRHGSTRRPELRLSGEHRSIVPVGELVRVVIDGTEYHSPIIERNGEIVISGAFDTPRVARDPTGAPNRLSDWITAADIGFGRSVLVDIVVPGFRYGIRPPGTRAVYDTSEPPAESLREIAEQLDG